MSSPGKEAASLHDWFTAPLEDLNALFSKAQKVTEDSFNRHIGLYTPGKAFPSISVTGTSCQLQCQHCAGHFLHQMHPIRNPQELITFCQELARQKKEGCLISGGCDETGVIPLSPFFPAIKKIKESTDLFLNVHTGFLIDSHAQALSKTGIDCASVDIVGSNHTIETIYGLTHRTTADYESTLQALKKHQIPTAPHICVGLHEGVLVGELNALHLIKANIQPRLLVIIALMPTKGTPMAASPATKPRDIARVCAIARLLFPTTEIALGCMRPRGAIRRKIEQLAIRAGVTRLVQPTKATVQYLQKHGYSTKTQSACCVK